MLLSLCISFEIFIIYTIFQKIKVRLHIQFTRQWKIHKLIRYRKISKWRHFKLAMSEKKNLNPHREKQRRWKICKIERKITGNSQLSRRAVKTVWWLKKMLCMIQGLDREKYVNFMDVFVLLHTIVIVDSLLCWTGRVDDCVYGLLLITGF